MKKLILFILLSLIAIVFVNAQSENIMVNTTTIIVNITPYSNLTVFLVNTSIVIENITPTSEPSFCIDYDNGFNPFAFGFVGNNYDTCNKETGVVTEYYCKDGQVASVDYACTLGCNNIFIYNISTLYSTTVFNLNHEVGYCNPSSGYLDFTPSTSGAVSQEVNNETPTKDWITIVGGYVYETDWYSKKVKYADIEIDCGAGTTIYSQSNYRGYYEVTFPEGDCHLGDLVTACATKQLIGCNNDTLKIESKHRYLLSLPIFLQPVGDDC